MMKIKSDIRKRTKKQESFFPDSDSESVHKISKQWTLALKNAKHESARFARKDLSKSEEQGRLHMSMWTSDWQKGVMDVRLILSVQLMGEQRERRAKSLFLLYTLKGLLVRWTDEQP